MNINTYDGRLRNSDIPFINLSKENLILIYDSLEAEQAGNMLFKLTEYLYQGTEPSFETKIENSVWNNIMLLINRKAEGYFVKASVARENGKKGGRPKKSTLQEVTTTEFDIPKNVENPNKADLSPSNDKEVEQPQPIMDNATESLKIVKNEVKQSIPLRIVASQDLRPTEKLQELINSDDNFCTIYTRCINYIADYKLNPGDFVKSNSKNMAFSKLQRMFEEYGIAFNEDIKNFINNDVTAKMNSLARQEKIA